MARAVVLSHWRKLHSVSAPLHNLYVCQRLSSFRLQAASQATSECVSPHYCTGCAGPDALVPPALLGPCFCSMTLSPCLLLCRLKSWMLQVQRTRKHLEARQRRFPELWRMNSDLQDVRG